MAGTSDLFESVPVVDVHVENLDQMWPHMLDAVNKAIFISLDTEMSGLGERKKLMSQSVDDRYKSMCKAAQSRAILSFGVSCFSLTQHASPSHARNMHFTVQTYNIFVLCIEDFVVEPGSLKFLTEHGFDFNKQYSKGLPYNRGCENLKLFQDPVDFLKPSVRNFFLQIILASKPIILHNGLLDIVFLYENFYNQLPGNLMTFLADLSEIFTGGIYDTKYISEFHSREPASFLAYLFRKSQRATVKAREENKPHVTLDFQVDPTQKCWTEYISCSRRHEDCEAQNIPPCQLYASHGFCHQGRNCKLSHNIDLILDHEDKAVEAKKRKRRKKQKINDIETDDLKMGETDPKEVQERNATAPVSKKPATDGHRAGFDAFMTGFCMAFNMLRFRSTPSLEKLEDNLVEPDVMDTMQKMKNRISLSGKDVPLHITRSHFSKSSATHKAKFEIIKTLLDQNS